MSSIGFIKSIKQDGRCEIVLRDGSSQSGRLEVKPGGMVLFAAEAAYRWQYSVDPAPEPERAHYQPPVTTQIPNR